MAGGRSGWPCLEDDETVACTRQVPIALHECALRGVDPLSGRGQSAVMVLSWLCRPADRGLTVPPAVSLGLDGVVPVQGTGC